MYLYLGQDCVIREKTIIGIFDLDNTSTSKITREFLNRAQREGNAETVADDLPKAFWETIRRTSPSPARTGNTRSI